MTRQMLKASGIVLAMATITLGSAAVARAEERVIAKVPFDFIVDGVRLPAGKYLVRELAPGAGVVAITNTGRKVTVYTQTIASTPAKEALGKAELAFKKFDNHYFLVRVDPADGNERVVVLTPALMEQEIGKAAENAD